MAVYVILSFAYFTRACPSKWYTEAKELNTFVCRSTYVFLTVTKVQHMSWQEAAEYLWNSLCLTLFICNGLRQCICNFFSISLCYFPAMLSLLAQSNLLLLPFILLFFCCFLFCFQVLFFSKYPVTLFNSHKIFRWSFAGTTNVRFCQYITAIVILYSLFLVVAHSLVESLYCDVP